MTPEIVNAAFRKWMTPERPLFFVSTTADAPGLACPMAAWPRLLNLTVLDGKERFLGVTIAGQTEMTPRSLIASVPYAIMAGDVPVGRAAAFHRHPGCTDAEPPGRTPPPKLRGVAGAWC